MTVEMPTVNFQGPGCDISPNGNAGDTQNKRRRAFRFILGGELGLELAGSKVLSRYVVVVVAVVVVAGYFRI